MATTYEKIATTTLSSGAVTVTFSSIPATYTDLRIVAVPTAASAINLAYRFNGDTATNYSATFLYGLGSSAGSGRISSYNALYATFAGNVVSTPTMWAIDIFSYGGSTNKTALFSMDADLNGSGAVGRNVGLWRSTAAITSVSVYTYSGVDQFTTGSTFTLYGIKAA
jgi:hypothetical protein